MRSVGQIKQFASEQLMELVTDPVLANVLLTRWINLTHDRILEHTFWRWNTDQIALAWPLVGTVNQASVLYLPHFVGDILTFYPSSLPYRAPGRIVDAYAFDRTQPGSGVLGELDTLVLYGFYGVEADMPTTGTILFTSSVGAAGAGVQLLVEGLDANQRAIRELVTLGGAGTVTTAATFRAGVGGVRTITIAGGASATTGIITATSGSTTLERLDSASELTHWHQRTEMYSGASGSSAAFTIRYYRRVGPFTADYEVPRLPPNFHDLLELGVLRWLRDYQGFPQEAVALEVQFQARLTMLMAANGRAPGQKFSMSTRR